MTTTEHARGAAAEFRVTFYVEAGGNPVDPSQVALTIYKDGAVVAGPYAYPDTITRDLVGVYHRVWLVPADAELGDDYTAAWSATIAGAVRSGYESFAVVDGGAVVPGLPGSWATVADVYRATGTAVTDAVLAQAQSTIDVAAGRTYAAAPRTGARDVGWLRLAVAYQAAWLTAQPDMFVRMDITSTGGSGDSAVAGAAGWLTLAPMARRALNRCSWIRSRSLHVRSEFLDGPAGRSPDPTAEVNDSYESWTPLGGA